MKSQFSDYQFSKEVLSHIYENYIKNNNKFNRVKFKKILKSAAKDYGLTYGELKKVLSLFDKKTFKRLGRQHNERRKLIKKAKWWLVTKDYPKIIKILKLSLIWSWLRKYFF